MNKALKIAIGIATIGIIGTAGYLIYQAVKRNRDGEGEDEQAPAVDPPAVVEGGKEDSSDKTPFTNKAQGNLFREWINKFYPTYAKANDISVSGDFDNAFIRKAWGKYGDVYKKGSPTFLKVKGNAIPELLLKAYNSKKDKGVLGSNSSGDIYLRTTTLGKLISKDTYAYFYGSGKINFLLGSTRVASGRWWDNGKKISIDNKTYSGDNFYNTAFEVRTQLGFSWGSKYGDVVVKLSFDGNLASDLEAPSRKGLDLDMNIID
jgi:hypothetical protein